MDFNLYYFYAISVISDREKDFDKTIHVLKQILESGYVLSRRLQGNTNSKTNGWNGIDYISLCNYFERNVTPYDNNPYYQGYNAYNTFVSRSLSLIIDKKRIRAIKPKLVEPVIFDWESLEKMRILGNATQRFSDLPDEIQVKNRISLAKMVGITLPLCHMGHDEHTNTYYTDLVIHFFEELTKLLESYERNIPIYDLETKEILESRDDVNAVLKRTINK